jgi:hypothetical protein
MSRLQAMMIVAALLAATGAALAQGAITATVDQSGLIEVSDGAPLAMIELNAHGPNWQHAPQETATGQVNDLPGGDGVRVTSTLPIPDTDDGAIDLTQSVHELPQGLRIEYELTMARTMRLNGLQLSVNLPVARYAGGEVMIRRPHDDPDIAGLPEETTEGRTQLWRGDGAIIEVDGETPDAVTIELRASTDVVVQDLRQWEGEVFEIRFPAIMEDPPREVRAGDRFHLDLTVTFAGPMTLQAG